MVRCLGVCSCISVQCSCVLPLHSLNRQSLDTIVNIMRFINLGNAALCMASGVFSFADVGSSITRIFLCIYIWCVITAASLPPCSSATPSCPAQCVCGDAGHL